MAINTPDIYFRRLLSFSSRPANKFEIPFRQLLFLSRIALTSFPALSDLYACKDVKNDLRC